MSELDWIIKLEFAASVRARPLKLESYPVENYESCDLKCSEYGNGNYTVERRGTSKLPTTCSTS